MKEGGVKRIRVSEVIYVAFSFNSSSTALKWPWQK